MTLKQVIEALVFASPKPISTREIIAALKAAGEGTEDQFQRDYAKAREAEVATALAELQADYIQTGRAFQLVEQVTGWSLVSEAAAGPWVRQLYPEAKPTRLTGPQLETLAIVAYRQPVTRADIEAVRGVAVDGVMQVLLDRGLVKIAGRAEVPGRPLLYNTTEYFLQHFGLRNTDELPNSGELRRVPLPTAPVPEPKLERKKAAAEPPLAEDEQPREGILLPGEAPDEQPTSSSEPASATAPEAALREDSQPSEPASETL